MVRQQIYVVESNTIGERYNVIWHHLHKEWQAGLRLTFSDSLGTTGGIYRELNSSIAFVVEAVKLQKNGDNFVYNSSLCQ